MTEKVAPYINRESSWLDFNLRVLEEAQDEQNPLLERLKFLAITSNNLDEFTMVRLGSLHLLLAEKRRVRDLAGMTPRQQFSHAISKMKSLVEEQYSCYRDELEPALRKEGIQRVMPEDLSADQRVTLHSYFQEELAPVLTPAAILPEAPLPRFAGLTLHLLIRLRDETLSSGRSQPRMAVLPVIGSVERFVQVRMEEGYGYILIEDLLGMFMQEFFPDDDVLEVLPFRISRNADMAVSEDAASDLLESMSELLDARKESGCVRLELPAGCTRVAERQLRMLLGITEDEVFRVDGPLNFADYFAIASLPGYDHLRQDEWPPLPVPGLDPAGNIFSQIAAKSRLMHHPFHQFDPVVSMVQQAAEDDQVIAIKQILYRTSKNSPIVNALMRAARNGKAVTVIVELKARFDEARNIEWARTMEQAGVQVIYGVKGLKTHAKLLIVMRREADGIHRYMHFGTGNYNEGTAKLYTDVSYLTSNANLGADASQFFNMITGFSQPQSFRRISASPLTVRSTLVQQIEAEAERARQGEKAIIRAKFNSLADQGMIDALYEASQAGVKIELLIRGICCLRPGVRGLSENIRVVSVIDRCLEHSRIFWFRNGGKAKVYISSADWMTRNLDKRVELMTPIDEGSLKSQLEDILEWGLKDSVKGRELGPDGTYHRMKGPKHAQRSQVRFYQQAAEAAVSAKRRKRTTFEPHRPR